MDRKTVILAVFGLIFTSIILLGYIGYTFNDGEQEKPTYYYNEYIASEPPEWRLLENKSLGGKEHAEVELYEITRYPEKEPTKQNYEQAWRLYNQTYEAAEKNGWFNHTNAREDGFKRLDYFHWLKTEFYFDNETLNPEKPETLIYYDPPENLKEDLELNDSDKILAGVMFFSTSLEKHGEQFAGPLSLWHTHPRLRKFCYKSYLNLHVSFDEYECPENSKIKQRDPEMIHIWFAKNPEGPFSSGIGSLSIDQLRTIAYQNKTKSDLKPDKMNKTEFINFTRDNYEKYFNGKIVNKSS